MPSDTLRRVYKKHTSGYAEWEQKAHAEDYMIFPENIGEYLSIDEVALSQGELYTFLTNKNGRSKRSSLVACVKGTLSENIIEVLCLLPEKERNKVKEITLDMAKNMESAVRKCFPKANLVTDRFHVVKLVLDAVQHIRIKQRWKELEIENTAIAEAKGRGERYIPIILGNGDTPKQLLARSRYILAKKPSSWTNNQKQRAEILFKKYPDIKKAYKHMMEFRNIYETKSKSLAESQIACWIKKTRDIKIKEFNTAANTIEYNKENILNFFNNRHTNANAESFNSKIKLFRANLRGVTDTSFFLFRLSRLFA